MQSQSVIGELLVPASNAIQPQAMQQEHWTKDAWEIRTSWRETGSRLDFGAEEIEFGCWHRGSEIGV